MSDKTIKELKKFLKIINTLHKKFKYDTKLSKPLKAADKALTEIGKELDKRNKLFLEEETRSVTTEPKPT
jgi:hypothetical protein